MSVAAHSDPVPPRAIGPYEIEYEIGRGGMGVVYRALRLYDGAAVALKIASAEMADLFGFIRREIQTLRRLQHPGVVRILDEGTEKGVPWYVMELLEAHSLGELLGLAEYDRAVTEQVHPFIPVSGVLPSSVHARTEVRSDLPRVLTLMYRLARVLAHIHAHGIIHRDIKPENVLVRAGDRPVLVDFGLVGRHHDHSGREVLEIAGQMLGTALYASPEQASGELVDARSDLYSFGVMLYEIVTGVPPFDGTSAGDVLFQHLTRNAQRPSEVVRNVPPALDNLIMHLLEKRRADRLGYADDVAALLVDAGAQYDADFGSEPATYLYRPEIVGRRETVEALRACLPDRRKRSGAFVVIGGESGIGKTSVASVFGREATLAGFGVIAGECMALATSGDVIGGQALHPLRPLFRAIADHCRGDAPRAVESILGPRLAVLRDHDPAFEALVELRSEETPRIPPEIACRRLFSDVAETLHAFARERPHVLVIDDLQWADEVTLRFLSTLDADFFANTPLMLLGTYRADEAGPDLRALLARPHVVKMPLKRLAETCVHDIVRSMLAAPGAPESFLRFVANQCEGNPFFVAEYLRAAVAERLLYREGGHWHVQSARSHSFSDLGLPRTLRNLVARRLGSISASAGRVVEAAAVLGREVDEALLIATCGENACDAQSAIAELLELYVMDPADRGIRFAHDKLREAAYDRIAPERLATLHARAAQAIESACTDDDSLRANAAALAHHWDVAGQHGKAIHYYSTAGELAITRGACRDARDLLRRAISLDKRNADAEPVLARRIRHARWHRLLGRAGIGLGDLDSTAEHLNTSLELLGVKLPRGTRAWQALMLLEITRQAMHLLLPRAFYRARSTKTLVLKELSDSAVVVAELSYYLTNETAMVASALIGVNIGERLTGTPANAFGYFILGFACGMMGLHRLSNRYLTIARDTAATENDLFVLANVAQARLHFHTARCDWKEAPAAAEEATLLSHRCGDPQALELLETHLGHWEFYTGKLSASADRFARLAEFARKRNNQQHEAWGHIDRARALIFMGDLETALDLLDASRRLVGINDALSMVVMDALRALTLLHLNQLDAAVEAADTAYASASKNRPTFFEMLRGFSSPAEVYLEVWVRARYRDPLEAARMRRTVSALLRKLRHYAARAPILAPSTLRLAGVAQCLDGSERRGTSLLRKAAATAARLGLLMEEGIALYELTRHAVDPRERADCRERARTIFHSIGCELYLRKMAERANRSTGGTRQRATADASE
ncbi:MAG TPA: protein kinase [Thermoanaerobaculia bacterium]|nr:protein kinase [Thermoanaerobaculia bacterium]